MRRVMESHHMTRIEGAVAYFVRRAREAQDHAAAARTAAARKEWLDIARHWEEIAQNAERLDLQPPRQ